MAAGHTTTGIAIAAVTPLQPALSASLPEQSLAACFPGLHSHGSSTGHRARSIIRYGQNLIRYTAADLSPGLLAGTITVHANSALLILVQAPIADMMDAIISVMHSKSTETRHTACCRFSHKRQQTGEPGSRTAGSVHTFYTILFIKQFEYILPKCYRGKICQRSGKLFCISPVSGYAASIRKNRIFLFR
jgi:hypothetical protein